MVERHGSGAPWEAVVGYSRVVRAGDLVLVAGTTGIGLDGRVVPGGAGAQARQALANVVAALERVGAAPADVVRTRMYVTDIADWEDVGRAHGEVFSAVRPVTAMVQVAALIDPAMVVEVEAEAWLGGQR